MKILRLYYLLPPIKGGMEKHVYYLTNFQNKENQATVFFNQGDKITSNDKKLLPLIKFYKIRPLFIGVFAFYFCVILRLIFNRSKFDVIHIHGDWSSLVFVKLLKKLTNAKKVIYTNHDAVTDSYQHTKLLPKGLSNADLIFTTGYDSADVIRKRIANKKIVVQPSGVNDVFYKPSEKIFDNATFKVVTVANLVTKKNIKFILEIAKDLLEIQFSIVGKGPEYQMLSDTITNNKLSNVNLLGFKTPEMVKQIYDESDCYLLTSFAEGTPTSALEAMTSGLPIVSSNAGGINNIVKESINGFVINDFSKELYINKLQLLKDNVKLRKEIYLNNKQLSENFKWDKVASRITRLTKECLDEK